MAVTPIDVPGSTLPTSSEPLDFTVTDPSLIVAISVSYGPTRVEERVWRDGAFLYPFHASTRTLGTFTVRREGGWPLDPRLYVDECGASITVVVDASGNTVMDGANMVIP